MKAVIQRVKKASVSTEGRIVGSIGKGIVILLGVCKNDTMEKVKKLAEKCISLRIFEDANGKFDRSLLDVGGESLIISQFTLYADTRKGRRPSFTDAASKVVTKPLYERFISAFRKRGIHTETGTFGAKMLVNIENDGPVTLIVQTLK